MKCDRGQPACGWCARNGAPCEYKERKKPGLRAGYGRELEQRLDKLEEKLRQHAEILQVLTSNMNAGSGLGSNVGSAAQPNPPSIKGSQPSEQGTPKDPMPSSMFSRPNSDPIPTPHPEANMYGHQKSSRSIDYEPSAAQVPQDSYSTTGLSPRTHMQPSAALSGAAGPSTSGEEYYGNAPSVAATLQSPATVSQRSSHVVHEAELPPYDLLYSLVDLYFKHINTWCPILHRKHTFETFFGQSMIDEEDKVLLHAIVATTLRYSTDPRLTDESRQRFHDSSKQRVLLYGMEHLSVKTLQALVILALDLCGTSHGPPGWNVMALITRAVVQLGLAVESNSFMVAPSYTSIYTLRAMILPEPRDFIEEESRRRLFWMVYLLDRYATIATAFEFGVDDREIDRKLPCREDLWLKNQKVETRCFSPADDSCKPGGPCGAPSGTIIDKPENLGAFSYYIEILGILSNIHKFLKRPVDISALADVETWQMRYKELDSQLATWKYELPPEYGNMDKLYQPAAAKSINCCWIMLHATFHTAVIRLHSSAAYPTTRSPIFHPSYLASQRCLGAVAEIAKIRQFVVSNNLLTKLGPPFAFTLWVAARVLLVHGSTVERKLDQNQIAPFVDTLREMGRYWPIASRYCNLLCRVLDEYHDSERQGRGETPSSVAILADMRRTAFDLDWLISRQPRIGNGGTAHVGGLGTSGIGHAIGSACPGPGVSGSGWQSRFASVTPAARTPQPNELEYLDVFDFFNVPRLPVGQQQAQTSAGADGGGGPATVASAPTGAGQEEAVNGSAAVVQGPQVVPPGEFNITDFMMEPSRDWLFPQQT